MTARQKWAVRCLIVLAMLTGVSPAGATPNPVMRLAPSVRATFTCIIWHESRSTWTHFNLTDNSRWGSSGIFQIIPLMWSAYGVPLGIRVPVWRASIYEQERVAVNIWRHDGFVPWQGDGCV